MNSAAMLRVLEHPGDPYTLIAFTENERTGSTIHGRAFRRRGETHPLGSGVTSWRWTIVVGSERRRCWRRRTAARVLRELVLDALTDRAIDRVALRTYRPGFDDRMRDRRGWRA